MLRLLGVLDSHHPPEKVRQLYTQKTGQQGQERRQVAETALAKHLSYSDLESESEGALSCLTLCDPMDSRLPGFSVHGIFQARILEWVVILGPGKGTKRRPNRVCASEDYPSA